MAQTAVKIHLVSDQLVLTRHGYDTRLCILTQNDHISSTKIDIWIHLHKVYLSLQSVFEANVVRVHSGYVMHVWNVFSGF